MSLTGTQQSDDQDERGQQDTNNQRDADNQDQNNGRDDGQDRQERQDQSGQQHEVDTFVTVLSPTNNSGAHGVAVVTLNQDTLDQGKVTVDIAASGLTPGEEHPLHIHGFDTSSGEDSQISKEPTLAFDQDRDGFVEDHEAEQAIGPVILSLTKDGQITDAQLRANFPEADQDGRLDLHQTYRFDLNDPKEREIFDQLKDHLDGRAVQLHGLEVKDGHGEGTKGEVDGTGGYKEALPAAVGILHELPQSHDVNVVVTLEGVPSVAHETTDFLFS
jgi:hypothetical protein